MPPPLLAQRGADGYPLLVTLEAPLGLVKGLEST